MRRWTVFWRGLVLEPLCVRVADEGVTLELRFEVEKTVRWSVWGFIAGMKKGFLCKNSLVLWLKRAVDGGWISRFAEIARTRVKDTVEVPRVPAVRANTQAAVQWRHGRGNVPASVVVEPSDVSVMLYHIVQPYQMRD